MFVCFEDGAHCPSGTSQAVSTLNACSGMVSTYPQCDIMLCSFHLSIKASASDSATAGCNNLPVGSSVAIQVSNSGSSGDGSCHFSSSCGGTSGLPSWDVSPGHSAQSGTIFITSACNFGYTVKNEDIIHSNHCLVAVQFMLPTPSPSVTPTRTPPPSPSRTASPSHVLSSVASASPSPSGRWPPSSDQHAAKRLLYGLVGGGAAAILCLGVAFVIRRRARGGSATAEELQTLVPGEHPNQDTGRAASLQVPPAAV